MFHHLFAMKWWDKMPWFVFFECCVLHQFCHSPLLLSPRSYLFLFTFCQKGGVIFIREVNDISPSNLIPACTSYSLAFNMIYSAYKLNKQDDKIQPWHTPFPIWNWSVVPCPVLTVVSWPAYRFLRMQVRWCGIPISFRIFHSLLWSTQSKALT